MARQLQVRELSEEERSSLQKLVKAQKASAILVKRATMVWHVSQHMSAHEVGRLMHVDYETVGRWVHRFNQQGIEGLKGAPRSGRPHVYQIEQVSQIITTALTDPKELGLPFGSWTLDRLEAYLNEEKGIPIKRSQIDEILLKEGLRWRKQERWFGVRVDPDFAQKRGPLSSFTKGRRPRASSSV